MNGLIGLLGDDLPTLAVKVPEWGTEVSVKALDGVRMARLMNDSNGAEEFRPALLVTLGLCDNAGNYRVPLGEVTNTVPYVNSRNGLGLLRLAGEVAKLSKLDQSVDDEKKD